MTLLVLSVKRIFWNMSQITVVIVHVVKKYEEVMEVPSCRLLEQVKFGCERIIASI